MDLACKIGSVGLIGRGTIVGSATLNITVLGTISGADLISSTFTEAKSCKRKIEMCKFAYTSYEKNIDWYKVISERIGIRWWTISRLHQSCRWNYNKYEPLYDKFENKYN